MVRESTLKFLGYKVNNIYFSLNPNFRNQTVQVDFNLQREILSDDPANVKVKLSADVFKNSQEKNYPFELKIELTGLFDFTQVQDDDRDVFLLNNTIAILFPYLRAIITSVTAAANISPPLVMPAINVVKTFENANE